MFNWCVSCGINRATHTEVFPDGTAVREFCEPCWQDLAVCEQEIDAAWEQFMKRAQSRRQFCRRK